MTEQPYTIFIVADEPYENFAEGVQTASWNALLVANAASPCALTVTLTSAEHVQELNRDYAGNDYATDVLSFAAEDDPYAVEPGAPPYIGDVIIAVPIAEKQAEERGHTLMLELQTLAIHGTLHLLGFDHQTPDQQAEMWAYESAAIDATREASG